MYGRGLVNIVGNNKRKGEKPIPDDIENYLNDAQQVELNTIEKFGWSLKFIRRPLFQDNIVVVANPDGSSFGILEEDGVLNLQPDIEIRI